MQTFTQSETIVVLDFETTGLYADEGDRAIEIGAVLLRGQEVSDPFSTSTVENVDKSFVTKPDISICC